MTCTCMPRKEPTIQTTIRLPGDLMDTLQKKSVENDRSFTNEMQHRLIKSLEGENDMERKIDAMMAMLLACLADK